MKKSREELNAEINIRAWKDPQFKDLLIKDPNAAFAQMGKNVPKNVKIYIHEETENTTHFVLHKAPVNAKNMSESELKKIAAAAGATYRENICATEEPRG